MSDKKEIQQGISYGIISGTLTTIGIILGFIHSNGIKKKIILTAIISAVIADSISDGYSIYFSNKTIFNDNKQAIKGGVVTFAIKLSVGLTFCLPFIFSNNIITSIYICIIWSYILLFLDSLYIAKIKHYDSIQTRNEIMKQIVLGSTVLCVAYLVSHSIETYYS